MKTKITMMCMLIFLSSTLFAQHRLTEKDVIQNSHIDFSRQYISFVLSGLIEIDGHVFLNDTCRSPIKYRATLDKVILIDTVCGNEYTHRICNKPGCKIIHLTEVAKFATWSSWGSITTPGTLSTPGYGTMNLGYGTTLDTRGDTLRLLTAPIGRFSKVYTDSLILHPNLKQ